MKADAVVAGGDAASCVAALYASSGPFLGRVIAIGAAAQAAGLRDLRRQHPGLIVLEDEIGWGSIGSWNRGLALRERDVLLVDAGVRLDEGSVAELLEVLHASDGTASVVPLDAGPAPAVDCRGVPRSHEVRIARAGCVLLRHAALNMIGGFDASLPHADALADWCLRAARMGLRHLCAHRAFAAGAVLPLPAAPHAPLLLARHPYLPDVESGEAQGAEALAAEHCLRSAGHPVRACASAESASGCQVLHSTAPVNDARELLALLQTPCHLVLGGAQGYRDRALLFAAAQAAQAVVAASEEERRELVSSLALDPARVEVVKDAAALAALFRRVVERPLAASLRYRSLLIDLLRFQSAA